MKNCPLCRREYLDETLNFCLDDGTPLLFAEVEPPTAILRSEQVYEFGSFCLDVAEKSLHSEGKPVAITPKVFAALHILVENAGRLLEKDRLIQSIWPDQFVEEGNLSYTIRMLRKALGDEVESPRFIETVPKRGYRFIAEVKRRGRESSTNIIQPTWVETVYVPDNMLTDSRQGIYGALVGRTKEIGQIKNLLNCSDVRLLTLTGIGGTGKTRLGREIAKELKGCFADGCYWVDLASVVDPMLVPPAIAQSIGVKDTGQGAFEALSDHLSTRSTLLILDNLEQVISAGVHLARLLNDAPGLKLLVTSREPLKLRMESEFKVPPLALPVATGKGSISELMSSEAVQLFVQCAERATADFELNENNAEAVAAICKKLDGLPLALELAALRTKVLSVSEILTKLENSLALLTGGSRDMPSRQQTMRSAIAWSYDLLSVIEKSVFIKLSVFDGSFSFSAAENVLMQAANTSPALTESDILDSITSITEKGLLLTQRSRNDELRFRMLVVVRDFAQEELSRAFDTEALRQSHAEYVQGLVETAAPYLFTSQSPEWLDRLELELDNIRAAIRWSLDHAPTAAARILSCVRHLAGLRWHTRETRHWLELALNNSDALSPDLQCELLTGLGVVSQYQLDYAVARAHYEASLKVARAMSDQKLTARALRGIGALDYMESDLERAFNRVSEALAISRSIGDEFGEAAALARQGDIYCLKGDYLQAQKFTAEALAIFRRLGYKQGVASKLANLSITEFNLSNYDEARKCLIEGMKEALEIGDLIDFRISFEVAAALMVEEGDYRTAAQLAGIAAAQCEDMTYFHEPVERRFRERYLAKLGKTMTENELTACIAEGQKMTVDEAVQLAREAAMRARQAGERQ